jgi:hypothetical protein
MEKRMLIVGAVLLTGLMAQDRFALKTPNGIAFSEFGGYETWQYVAPSVTNDQIKIIAANPVMIAAYKDGFPANGKPVPDGAMFAKIEWAKATSPDPGHAAGRSSGARFHGEGLEEIPGHEWLGIRRFQV